MPAIETMHRHQLAMHYGTTPGDFGEPIADVSGRTELKVRWQYVNEEAVDAQGNSIGIDAKVVLDRDVAVGDYMWLGGIENLPSNGIPTSNIMKVVGFVSTPDLKGRHIRRTALLQRFSDTLPT